MATHFTAFNPIKAKYSFHSISSLQWKLLVEEKGLNSYSWYRQYTLKIHSQDVRDMYGGQGSIQSDFEALMRVPSNLLLAPSWRGHW